MRRALAASVAATLVLLTPSAAEAAKSSARSDPEGDVASQLDLKRAKLTQQGKKATRIVVRFRTWEAFTDDDIAFPSGLGVDFRVSKKMVRAAAVRSRDGEVEAEICSYRAKRVSQPRKCSSIAVKRTSDRSFRLTIPLRKIDKGARTLRWRASSFAMSGTAGCSSTCVDGLGKGGSRYYRWRL